MVRVSNNLHLALRLTFSINFNNELQNVRIILRRSISCIAIRIVHLIKSHLDIERNSYTTLRDFFVHAEPKNYVPQNYLCL